MSEFEPKIVAYCCNFCAFAAADLAGAMRLQYPPNVRIIKLPCTGKVDAIHLMKAFEDGADGVFVAGCLEGQCHYLEGNLRAKKRVAYVKRLLAEVQIEPERIDMFNLSSAMGGRFAEIVEEMTQRIKDLGPVNANETRQAVKS
ncbi:MAG: heterodisulfide reductase subunit MvhD [Planctomycetes bacterium B3_Pla]|nr:MAG: heterodisulfide reductase subunit MvhD [Planctomycetes bacterium B3_Pla]